MEEPEWIIDRLLGLEEMIPDINKIQTFLLLNVLTSLTFCRKVWILF
jgi:hypothetical protein